MSIFLQYLLICFFLAARINSVNSFMVFVHIHFILLFSVGIEDLDFHEQSNEHADKVLPITRGRGRPRRNLSASQIPIPTGNRRTKPKKLGNFASAVEIANVYHTVQHNHSYASLDCTVNLNRHMLKEESKTAAEIKCGRTKAGAIAVGVLAPYVLQQVIQKWNYVNELIEIIYTLSLLFQRLLMKLNRLNIFPLKLMHPTTKIENLYLLVFAISIKRTVCNQFYIIFEFLLN